jgi:hypothetical protein
MSTASLSLRISAVATDDDPACSLRGNDLQRILAEEFGVLRSLAAVYLLLRRLGYLNRARADQDAYQIIAKQLRGVGNSECRTAADREFACQHWHSHWHLDNRSAVDWADSANEGPPPRAPYHCTRIVAAKLMPGAA